MGSSRRGSVGVIDVLYTGAAMGTLLATVVLFDGRYDSGVGVLMGVFALLILVVDWQQTRQIEVTVESARETVALAVVSLLVLGVWVVLATRDPNALASFFALLAGFFFLAAVREAILLDLTPVELLLQGYASLVAVYLVLGAATDAVDQYEGALVVIGVGVYIVRNLFWWTGAVLDRIVGGQSWQE